MVDRLGGLSRLLHEGAGLLLVAPLWLWWAIWRGAWPTTVWAPGLVYLALAAVALAVSLPMTRPRGARAVALGALAGLTLLSGASLLWAADPGSAWTGAERSALYLLSLALPLLWPPSPRALLVGLAAWPLCAVAGGVAGLIGSLRSPETMEAGRLISPAGYANASAALFLMGLFPAVVLASRRELPAPLRVVLTAAAGALGGLALLTQSRGMVLAIAVVAIVAFALVPNRLRLAVPLALVAGVVALLSGELIDVRNTWQAGDESGAVWDAVAALTAIALALAALATAYVLLDRRFEPSRDLVRRAALAARAGLAAAVLVGAVLFAVTQGDPVAWGKDRWNDFKTPDYIRVESETNRFAGGLGSNRYDYWRASADIVADRPLSGTGADNFSAAYLERRRTIKAPIFAHSVWFSAAGELGIGGLLLLAALVAALAVALIARWRGAPGPERALIVAAGLPATYLLVHTSGDFLHAFPALTVPALALAAAATAPAERPTVERRAPRLGAGIAALLIALSVVPLFLGARLMTRAAETWPDRPAGALADLERAAEIDPLTAAAPLQRGIIALEAGRPELAEASFRQSLERDEHGWFAKLELALLAAQNGDRERALALLAEVERLNPREPELPALRGEIEAGRAPDSLAVARRIVERGG